MEYYDNHNGNQADNSTNLAGNDVHFTCNVLAAIFRDNDYMSGTKNNIVQKRYTICHAFAKDTTGNEFYL